MVDAVFVLMEGSRIVENPESSCQFVSKFLDVAHLLSICTFLCTHRCGCSLTIFFLDIFFQFVGYSLHGSANMSLDIEKTFKCAVLLEKAEELLDALCLLMLISCVKFFGLIARMVSACSYHMMAVCGQDVEHGVCLFLPRDGCWGQDVEHGVCLFLPRDGCWGQDV